MAAVMSPASAADLANTGATPTTVSNTAPANDTTPARSATLRVSPEVQEYQNWCWAASGTAIAKYKGVSRASQNEFCLAGRGLNVRLCPDEPAQMYNVQRGLQHYGVGSGRTTGVLSFADVQRNIDNDSPIPVGYYWRAGGGHLVTIIGYNTQNSTVTVIDSYPSHQRRQTHTYDSFVQNNRWRWSQSITGVGGRAAVETPETTQPAATAPQTTSNTTSVEVSADAQRAVTMAKTAEALARVTELTGADNSRSDGTSATAADEAFTVNTLNPDFVNGTSTNPAVAEGHAVRAETAAGDAATMLFTRVDGQLTLTTTTTGDEATRFGAMADGGTIFQEPQTNSWFRMADGKVEALNDAARKVLNGSITTVAEYQKSVSSRFADKMEGSTYQTEGYFGGIKN